MYFAYLLYGFALVHEVDDLGLDSVRSGEREEEEEESLADKHIEEGFVNKFKHVYD